MVCASKSSRRAVTTTDAPALARDWAIVLPIPVLAPVTQATFPDKSKRLFRYFSSLIFQDYRKKD
jgi:hypothetical protein